jgi:hypothetical protein
MGQGADDRGAQEAGEATDNREEGAAEEEQRRRNGEEQDVLHHVRAQELVGEGVGWRGGREPEAYQAG